ncbi:MAG TPA: sodium-dependent bicarbonate transport family permease, partial [Pelomicrobium sp.]|nr:sodium-dependent bicarbonate transport family permease [Pelomicrobium sp.]
MEPVVLFFVLGVAAGLLRSDLKIPGALYEALSIYLLLAIGLKGGVELARHSLASIVLPSLAVIALGLVIPLIAFGVLRLLGRLPRPDAAAVAAHYGSVSVVTFAVGASYAASHGEAVEGVLTVFLVLLEFPALVVGVLLARWGHAGHAFGRLVREVFVGKSLFLLLGGLLIGWFAGPDGIAPLDRLFFDLFKGVLAFFLLEMGLVAAGRIADVRRFGAFLIGFALAMPLLAAALGLALGWALGLSIGGTALLATLAGSASYIAAPAAM